MKITNYYVIIALTHNEFKRQILNMLNDGWVLQGGVCMYVNEGLSYFSQALVLHEEVK